MSVTHSWRTKSDRYPHDHSYLHLLFYEIQYSDFGNANEQRSTLSVTGYSLVSIQYTLVTIVIYSLLLSHDVYAPRSGGRILRVYRVEYIRPTGRNVFAIHSLCVSTDTLLALSIRVLKSTIKN